MVILKFGGTSVSSAENILNICQIVRNQPQEGSVVVVSALSGVTDLLLSLPRAPRSRIPSILKKIERMHLSLISQLFVEKVTQVSLKDYVTERLAEVHNLILKSHNFDLRSSDQIVSFGETMSSRIVAQVLIQSGIQSAQVIATELIVTNDQFGSAEFIPRLTEKKVRRALLSLIEQDVVPVVTGFIGATRNGQITTLGRGGSDYSASILGYALEAREVQIWTDVDGVFTADPRLVKDARLITNISYKEASEMANFGAKVLHPRTIRPAIQRNIPVRVLNTFNPKSAGSLITQEATYRGFKSIAFKRKTTLINIYSTDMLFSKGYLAKIFTLFAKENISVDLVSVSEVSVSVTLDDHPRVDHVVSELKKFANVTFTSSVGIVSLVGEGIVGSDVLKTVTNLFHQEKILIKMISLGASDINISFVLGSEDIERAVLLLHSKVLSRIAPKNGDAKLGFRQNERSSFGAKRQNGVRSYNVLGN